MALYIPTKIEGNLQEIKNMVSTKSDSVPVLMVPVRLEARFMEVMEDVSSYAVVFSEVLYDIVQQQDHFRINTSSITAARITSEINRATKSITAIEKTKLVNLGGITPIERSWLRDEVLELDELANTFFSEALAKRFDTASKKTLRLAASKFKKAVQQLLKSIAALTVNPDTTYLDASNLISEMRNLESRSKTLTAEEAIPNSKPGKKDKLVAFIMSAIYAFEEFYKRDLEYYSTLVALEKNQLDQIKNTHNNLKANIKKIPDRIIKIHNDLNWQQAVNGIEKEHIKPLEASFEYFEEQILEKFEELLELQIIPATRLFYDSVKTLKALKEFNSTKASKFNTLKVQSKKVLNRLNTASLKGQQVIQAGKQEAAQLEQIWKTIDAEISSYKKNLNTIKVDKPGQKFSVAATTKKVDTIAKLRLNTFKDLTAGRLITVAPRDLNASAASYSTIMARLRAVNSRLLVMEKPGAKVKSSQKQQVLKDLEQLRADLKTAGSRRLVLTATRKKLLDKKVLEVAKRLKNIKTVDTKKKTVNVTATAVDLSKLTKKVSLATAIGIKGVRDKFKDDAVFVTPKTPVKQLWVRIFPDDFAIHTHEKALTAQELESGKDYWKEVWIASGDRDLIIGAWRALCEIHGTERAAYIAGITDPKKVSTANAKKFEAYPDNNLIEAERILAGVVDVLKNKKSRTKPKVLLKTIEDNDIDKQLKQAVSNLKKEDEVHEYLFYKLVNQVRRLQSLFTEAYEKLQTSRGGFRTSLEKAINPVFETFTELQEITAALTYLNATDFFRNTAITYTHPEVTLKEEDWTQAPHCRILPECFVLIARQGKKITRIKVGNKLIKDTLQVGLDPTKFDLEDIYQYTEHGGLEVDPDIKWLTDYRTAEIQGMAITLNLDAAEFKNGFDQLSVLGVKDLNALQGKEYLEDLLENHHYTPGGLELLKIGTPTNNTEDAKSGFSSQTRDFEESYDLELGADLFSENASAELEADGKLIAEALGVEPKIFQHIAGSDKAEMKLPELINRALFPGTLGYYLFEMMNNLFMEDDIDAVEAFFAEHVSARGSLPSLRVDAQPYGILPTTAFSKFETDKNDAFSKNLVDILKIFNREFDQIREEHVAHAYNAGEDPQAHFMEMLGLQTTSQEYYIRYGANTFMSYPAEDFPRQQLCNASVVANLFADFVNVEVKDGLTGHKKAIEEKRLKIELFQKSKIFSATFFAEHSVFTGTRVQEDELSFTEPLKRIGNHNYIEWLLHKNVFQILADNDAEQFPAKTMLFLLLRQSLLWTYDRAALEILKRENLISSFDKFNIGRDGFLAAPRSDDNRDTLVTKWSFLFRSLNKLDSGAEKPQDGFNKGSSASFYNYISGGTGNENIESKTMAAYLNPVNTALYDAYDTSGAHKHFTALAKVDKLRRAITKLTTLPSAVLDQLTAEHLDLCSYRLDAWLLGLVSERLKKQRKQTENGIYLAGWGYLEDLRPGGARTEVKQNKLPEALRTGYEPVYKDADNQGHIHMPSINHAITAAILRAGYKANQDSSEDIENQMAVNLSSARVRLAMQLIEGVRNGQEIGAILGYQLERGLHERYKEAEMDRFIYPLRQLFPLRPETLVSTNEDNYKANVVHGANVLEHIDKHIEGMDFPVGNSLYQTLSENNFARCPQNLKKLIQDNKENGSNGNKELKMLLQEIDRIADSYDALGDLVLSESVYQIAQGNHVRAGAVLEALAEGKNIPDCQIVSTPRTGTILTQRVVYGLEAISSAAISANAGLSANALNTNHTLAKPDGWSSKLTSRALAEPSLNKFLGKHLIPAAQIKCQVHFTREDVSETLQINFDELGLQPIDLVTILKEGQTGGSELNKRIAYLARAKATPKLLVDTLVTIDIKSRNESWSQDDRTLYELMPLISQLQNLLSDMRPCGADDLRLPPQETASEDRVKYQDAAELERRTLDAQQNLEHLRDEVDAFFTTQINSEDIDAATFTPAQINTMRGWLFELSDMGMPNAIPDAVVEHDDAIGQDLARQLLIIQATVAKKIAETEKLWTKYNTEKNPDNLCGHLVEIMRKIFGRDFRVVPQFKLQNTEEHEGIINLDATEGLMRHDTYALDNWLQSMGRVREKMYALEMTAMLTEVQDREFDQAGVVQLPYRAASADLEADYWLGAPYPETYQPDGDKLSLVIYDAGKLVETSENVAAVILDEWLEIIPNKTETTAVTFNYDQPDATPPQNILLAVTPKVTGNWDWNDLVDTIFDTVNLAKNRAVESDHLEKSKFAAILPAISSEVYPPNLTEEEHGMLPKTQVPLDFLAINTEKTPI